MMFSYTYLNHINLEKNYNYFGGDNIDNYIKNIKINKYDDNWIDNYINDDDKLKNLLPHLDKKILIKFINDFYIGALNDEDVKLLKKIIILCERNNIELPIKLSKIIRKIVNGNLQYFYSYDEEKKHQNDERKGDNLIDVSLRYKNANRFAIVPRAPVSSVHPVRSVSFTVPSAPIQSVPSAIPFVPIQPIPPVQSISSVPIPSVSSIPIQSIPVPISPISSEVSMSDIPAPTIPMSDAKESIASEEEIEKIMCKICFDNAADCAILPCAHFCSCMKCASLLNDCPICRTKIENRLKIFV